MLPGNMSKVVRRWYVVHTKPRQETLALGNLQRQSYTAYCPQAVQFKSRRRRRQASIEPLFPRYIFIELTLGADNFAPIRSTLGVSDLVRFGDQPAIISQDVIDAIRRQEQHLLTHAGSPPAWQAGDPVEIISGPFAGLKGVFQKHRGADRVMVLFEMLGCQSRVAVNANCIVSAS